MKSIAIHRHSISLLPECARVIIRPFIPGEVWRIQSILGRTLALTEEQVGTELEKVHRNFEPRHLDTEGVLLKHFKKVEQHLPDEPKLSHQRRVLIGALFSGEFALESAALFNPSIVPHPDQSDVPVGGLRFIMSLRATGEGHISSIEFRTGTISPHGHITIAPVSRYVSEPEIVPNPSYQKKAFLSIS